MTRFRTIIAFHALAFFCLLLDGCAGDMKDARKAASAAATFVGDMQQTTLDAVDQQQHYRQNETNRATELQVAAQLNLASVNQYTAIWRTDSNKDAQEIFKAVTGITSDSDLTKTAPFVILAPAPVFTAPTIDRTTFNNLIQSYNKLSQGLSPIDRAMALKPFVEVVVKSFNDSAKTATKQANTPAAPKATALTGSPTVATKSPAVPAAAPAVATAAFLSDITNGTSGAAGAPQQTPPPLETLPSNTLPVSGLLDALGTQ